MVDESPAMNKSTIEVKFKSPLVALTFSQPGALIMTLSNCVTPRDFSAISATLDAFFTFLSTPVFALMAQTLASALLCIALSQDRIPMIVNIR